MKTPIRIQLSFSHLVVLIIGMALAGTLVWLAVESLYLSTQRENLLGQADLTARLLEGSPPEDYSPEPYSQTTNVTPGIHTRLLSESGAVIIGVPFPDGSAPVQEPPGLDPGFVPAAELVERPEIRGALAGEGMTQIRRIDALDGQRVLYAAAPVFNEAGKVVNLVYLAMPLPSPGLPPDIILQLAAAGMIGAGIASLVGILLAGRIASPLERLEKAAGQISNGDLEQEVSLPGKIRELDNLGNSFNQMTASLRRSEELKDAFIADVTHELRTPLTVLKGTVETLEDGAVDDRSVRGGLLHSMNRETEKLIRLVNQLLLLARSDAGALSLDLQAIDLAELAQERAENLAPLAARKEILITLESPAGEGFPVLADRIRTAQVLDNILDNALRFAPPQSTVTISLQRSGKRVLCSIADSGPGIPDDSLPKIFDRFYRVEAARDRESGGSGLGLAIAKTLLEAQDGGIQAHSQPGQGTEMTFFLPARDLTEN